MTSLQVIMLQHFYELFNHFIYAHSYSHTLPSSYKTKIHFNHISIKLTVNSSTAVSKGSIQYTHLHALISTADKICVQPDGLHLVVLAVTFNHSTHEQLHCTEASPTMLLASV